MDNLASNVADMNIGDAPSRKKKPARAYHQFSQPQSNFAYAGNTSSPSPLLATGNFSPMPQVGQAMNSSTPTLGNVPQYPGTPQGYANGQNLGFPSAEINVSSIHTGVAQTVDLATQRLLDQKEYLSKTFDTSRDSILPLKTTQFYSVDTGSCDSRLMGLTMYNIPKNETLRNMTKLPMGVHVQPFAAITALGKEPQQNQTAYGDSQDGMDAAFTPEAEQESTQESLYVNEINPQIGIIRCKRCRAYNNHNFKFSGDQSSFVCNFCLMKSSVGSLQSSNSGMFGGAPLGSGEPNFIAPPFAGVLDFKAPPEYNNIPNVESKPLHYVFLVDISTFANGNKSSVSCIDAIQTSIEYIAKNQPFCKICIIGFDKNLHFFKLNKDQQTAQEFIVNDLYGDTRHSGNESGSVFLPFYDGLFVSADESMHVIEDTLNRLKTFCLQTNTGYVKHETDVCFGPALEAAMMALSTFAQGGKILCSLNALPKFSRGSLQLRKDDAFVKNLKFGDNDYYKKLGYQLLKSNCGVDLFITTDGFMDICNVGFPSMITGGQLKYYPHFQAARDDFQVSSDYLNSVSNTIGYQGSLKLRCSSGLSVDTYYKESCNFSNQEPHFAILTKETNVSILLKYDGNTVNSKEQKDFYFQTAVLYTNLKGERRIRVLNTSGAIQSNLFEIYKFVDQENVANIMIKDICLTLMKNQATDYSVVRKTIDNKLVDVFTQYRAVTNNHSVNNNMVLPESLKLLPTMMLAFESSKLMKQAKQSTRANERVLQLFEFMNAPLSKLFFKLYPQIIPLHVMMNQELDLVLYDLNKKLLSIDSTDEFAVSNSGRKLIDGGCYLIFTGDLAYFWYNQNTNPLLLKDLLGYDNTSKSNDGRPLPIEIECGLFPKVDTEINRKVSALLTYWKKLCYFDNYIKVVPLSPLNSQASVSAGLGGSSFPNILSYEILFDDKNIENIESLENYLILLHKGIKEKMDKQDYITPSKKDQQKEHAFQQWYQQT